MSECPTDPGPHPDRHGVLPRWLRLARPLAGGLPPIRVRPLPATWARGHPHHRATRLKPTRPPRRGTHRRGSGNTAPGSRPPPLITPGADPTPPQGLSDATRLAGHLAMVVRASAPVVRRRAVACARSTFTRCGQVPKAEVQAAPDPAQAPRLHGGLADGLASSDVRRRAQAHHALVP